MEKESHRVYGQEETEEEGGGGYGEKRGWGGSMQ